MSGPRNKSTGERKIDFVSLKKALKLIFEGNTFNLIIVGIALLLSTIFMVIGLNMTTELIDVQIPALVDNFGLPAYDAVKSKFVLFIIKMAVLYLGSVILSLIQNLIMVSVSQGTLRKIRHRLFSKMEYLPVSFFDQNKYGDIMSRYTNDVDTLENFITQTVPNFASSIVMLVAILASMIINSWLLTILTIILLALILFGTKSILSKSTKHFINRQKIVGLSNAYVEESMQGARVVQVFNHQEKSIQEFDKICEDYRTEDMKGNVFSNIVGPLSGNLIRIQYIITALVGSVLVVNNVFGYTIGALITFLTLSNNFTNPIGRMTEQISAIAQASAGSKRIFDMLEMESEVDEGYVTLVNYNEVDGEIVETDEQNHNWAWKHPHQDGTLSYTPLRGEIVLNDVDFSYIPGEQILYDINIYAQPGEKIALVGETGAGKTTITNLINRFYDIEDGKIRYDGININKIKKNDLRRSLGLVLQDTNLFTGTIKENIKLGREDATDDEVVEAAKIANADSFIRMMPNGYDTILTRAGEQLSQGQRQLLAIARAAIADCPVLILDEATSSIDTRTEAIVQDGMDKLMEGRTVFVVAHRLSTIERSDCIMVMDHGKIIERGNHKELIEKKGVYYQLYTGKFELE